MSGPPARPSPDMTEAPHPGTDAAPLVVVALRQLRRRGEVRRRDVGPAAQDRLLDLGDRLRHLDAARARLGAVEGRAAAPHALLVVEDVEAHLGALVAAVEDEAVRVDDRGRAEVLAVGPEDGARRGARRAQDAFRGVVEALALGGVLDPLLLGLVAGDEERLDLAVGGEE